LLGLSKRPLEQRQKGCLSQGKISSWRRADELELAPAHGPGADGGDYISTSFTADGLAHPVFAVASTPTLRRTSLPRSLAQSGPAFEIWTGSKHPHRWYPAATQEGSRKIDRLDSDGGGM